MRLQRPCNARHVHMDADTCMRPHTRRLQERKRPLVYNQNESTALLQRSSPSSHLSDAGTLLCMHARGEYCLQTEGPQQRCTTTKTRAATCARAAAATGPPAARDLHTTHASSNDSVGRVLMLPQMAGVTCTAPRCHHLLPNTMYPKYFPATGRVGSPSNP